MKDRDTQPMDVSLCIQQLNQGDHGPYLGLCALFADPALSEEMLISLLNDLSEVVDQLGIKCSSLLNKVKSLDWGRFSYQVHQAHSKFLVQLVLAHPYHLTPVMAVVVKKFIPKVDASVSVKMFEQQQGETYAKIYHQAHVFLAHLIDTVSCEDDQVLKLLHRCMPYFRHPVIQIRDYNRNLLKVCDYMPHLRNEILALIIEGLTKFDAMYGRETWRAALDDYSQFDMDIDNVSHMIDRNQQHEFNEKLDRCMKDLFDYLRRVSFDINGNFVSKEANKAYAALRVIFKHTILPLQSSSSLPFVWFYVCNFHPAYADDFVHMLWSMVINPTLQSLFRCNASCYLASFLSRAKFLTIEAVMDRVTEWAKWLNDYVKNQDDNTGGRSAHVHAVFYAMCSATFYVVAFRCKELTNTNEGLKRLKALKLHRLVRSSLNPLKYCDARVLSNFANFARNYHIVYCHEVIERNRRTGNKNATDDYGFRVFFPFDPCLLRRCAAVVNDVYNDYRETDDEPKHGNDHEVMDESAGSSSLKNTFKYSSSPGFMHAKAQN